MNQPKESSIWPIALALGGTALLVIAVFVAASWWGPHGDVIQIDQAPPTPSQAMIEVRVEDPTGAPIVDRNVTFQPTAQTQKATTTTTDSAGVATATFPKAGSIVVTVEGYDKEQTIRDLHLSTSDTFELVIRGVEKNP